MRHAQADELRPRALAVTRRRSVLGGDRRRVGKRRRHAAGPHRAHRAFSVVPNTSGVVDAMNPTRRHVLGGLGALVALPLLPSLIPATARSQGGKAPQRLVVYFLPNGRKPSWWIPAETGADF